MNENLINFLTSQRIIFDTNVDLKKKTWIHRGGRAGLFISPQNAQELEMLVLYLYREKIHFLIIGHTSNLYILNDCNIPVVVSTIKCKSYAIQNQELYCEAGVGVINLSKKMIIQGIKGFEYLTGLPGTIGAALVNNSSCRDNSISRLLISARVVLQDGTVKTLYPNDFGFEFRSSVFKKGVIRGTIVSANLKAEPGDISLMQQIAETNAKHREKNLEGYAKNLGCTVNRSFINGKMSFWLRAILFVYGIFSRVFIRSEKDRQNQRKKLICSLTGYKTIAPYVSSKNPIVFSWLDDNADAAFPLYLEFMKNVYKTDKLEIEVIK